MQLARGTFCPHLDDIAAPASGRPFSEIFVMQVQLEVGVRRMDLAEEEVTPHRVLQLTNWGE